MRGKRPINADLPLALREGPAPPEPPRASDIDPAPGGSKSDGRRQRRRRHPVPGALKGVAVLVAFAIVFLVAAVLGGGGGTNRRTQQASPTASPAPSAEQATPTAEAAEALGFPSVATDNTTRVGGSEPAATAAAVALAVYPSRTPAQRPAAVTLVDEGDWQGAVAAAVLMASPVRAPLLVTDGGDVPDATSQALEALAPTGAAATGGAQAFAIGAAARPDGLRTAAAQGDSPAAVAASAAALRERLAGEPPQHIVLAPQASPEFAAPAAAWAARSGDPVLFTGPAKLPPATARVLERHSRVPVYVLGPSSAISSDVSRAVAKVGNPVHRVAAEDPVENAIAFARYSNGSFGWNVNDPGHGFVLARSDAPLDAALAAPLSASGTWGPLLLTDDPDTLPKAVREYMLDVKPGYTTDPTRAFYNHVWVIGDQEAIGVGQQAEIDQLAELTRIGGER
ncbi:MAG: hypothetical protein ACM3N0_03180 [Chloroflexota bacterium]